MKQIPHPSADDLSTPKLRTELSKLIGGPLASRQNPPEATTGEVWLRRSWIKTAHRKARHLRGNTDHTVYKGITDEALLQSLGTMLDFDADVVLAATGRRTELEAIYEGLRQIEEANWK